MNVFNLEQQRMSVMDIEELLLIEFWAVMAVMMCLF